MHLADRFANSTGPFLIFSYVALAGFFIGLTGIFLSSAQKYIANRERMRIWKKEEDEQAHPTKRHFVS